ncbi:MAG: MogA/MoaB family molybdenum cofactor biosynthesis protein [Candidatus Bipolaricaulota bacterium]|nr:MogA/MoaB family molybdenum cofactor biosynthesis protein [Candidatus Bipolaricaulota bacterium]
MIRIGILTISDRSSRGERLDESGPVIERLVREQLDAAIEAKAIVPDVKEEISITLVHWADELGLDIIITTGGTGFSPRDITPEATTDVIEREAPGMAEAIRAQGIAKTPHAMLSRAICGIRGHTLIVNLPGSPKAVTEGLEVIMPALPHSVSILRGGGDTEHEYH